MKKNLLNMIRNSDRRLAAPLMGFPGIQLTNTTLKENLLNPDQHVESILKLNEMINPDVLLPMMNLSIEAGALGLPVDYPDNESPSVLQHPVDEDTDLTPYRTAEIFADPQVQNHIKVVKELKKQSGKPVCAYVAGPYTLAGLLMSAMEISMATIENPDRVLDVLEICSDVIIRYARALEEAGADAICVLDPTAMMLSPDSYDEFAGEPMRTVAFALKTPVILHICGNTTHLIENMCRTGASALSLDAAVDFAAVAPRMSDDVILMGNIDPANVMRRGSREEVIAATTALLDSMEGFAAFLPSNGCDLPPDTPIENIVAFTETVKSRKTAGSPAQATV